MAGKAGMWRWFKRAFVAAVIGGALCVLWGFFVEPRWVKVRTVEVEGLAYRRFVLLADLHVKDDTRNLEKACATIGELQPEAVFIAGDLVEHQKDLDKTLALLRALPCPVFAVPGNHEHWARVDLVAIDTALRATGGRCLVNEAVPLPGGGTLVGLDDLFAGNTKRPAGCCASAEKPVLALTHSPLGIGAGLEDERVDLSMAGHSHGGQVRMPFIGALILPPGCGEYERGMYDTPNGPLYVSPGLGTWNLDVRFLCRPEVTVLTGPR